MTDDVCTDVICRHAGVAQFEFKFAGTVTSQIASFPSLILPQNISTNREVTRRTGLKTFMTGQTWAGGNYGNGTVFNEN